MIFPGNLNLRAEKLSLKPVWVLVFLNVFVFLFVSLLFKDKAKNYSQELYAEQLEQVSKLYEQTLDPLELSSFDRQNTLMMVRDIKFWSRSQFFPFQGDAVQIKASRDFFNDLKESYFQSPQYVFGLSPQATSPWAWVTYQFIHTGFLHMLMNVLFLFLVVAALQKQVIYSWIYNVYLLSGFGGGVAYLMMNQNNEIAVVGASGAICGLMAFTAVVLNVKNIEWSYFLSPVPGYFGQIFLPAYLLFPVYLISDFTTVLYSNSGVQSAVAHSAHIGGTFVGFSLGALYLYDQKLKTHILKHWSKELSEEQYNEMRDKVS